MTRRMHDLEQEIERALEHLGIPREQFERQTVEEGRKVLTLARERFVDGNPRVWWLSLRLPSRGIPYDTGDFSGWSELLLREIPRGERSCWFIVETDDGTDDLPVYKVQVRHLPAAIGQCYFFEYYLVGEACDWFLADTDHNQLIITECAP